MSGDAPGARSAGKAWKRLLPWVASAGVVAWLFTSVDHKAFLDGLAKAKMAEALGWIAIFNIFVFLVDSVTLRVLIGRLLRPLPYRDVLAVKGVSYFLNAVTYSAGTGGIAYFVHKKISVPFLQSLSALVWLNYVDVIGLWLLLIGGWVLGTDRLPDPALANRVGVLLVAVGLIVIGAQIYWRRGVDFLVLGRFRSWRIFQAFARASWSDLATMVALRVSFIGLYVIMAWVLLPTFHIHVDLFGLLVYVPLLTFVQTIPASVAGLGAVQAVMIALYAPYVDPEIATSPEAADGLVLAFSTVVGPTTAIFRIGLGYLFLRDISQDLLGDEQAYAQARAAEEMDAQGCSEGGSLRSTGSGDGGSSSGGRP